MGTTRRYNNPKDHSRTKSTVTLPQWGRFSKWFTKEKPLRKWLKWFKSRNIDCTIKKVNAQYALFVYREWWVT